MLYTAGFEYTVYGEVSVSLPPTASDHDITVAIMDKVVGLENKFQSDFEIDFKNMKKESE